MNALGWAARDGESPVTESATLLAKDREYHGARGIPWEEGATTLQGSTRAATDSGEYREGTVKRTPVRGVKEILKPSAVKRSEGVVGSLQGERTS